MRRPTAQSETCRQRPARHFDAAGPSLRAFTVIELMVSVGVLVVAIFALASVFDISSETTGRTVAHAEVLEASSGVQQRIADLLSKIESGLLIIDSPAPTLGRAEINGTERVFRIRHDRLVFLALGSAGEFQSFTDPTRGTPADPTKEPAASREALIYLGPGIPLTDNNNPPKERPFDDETIRLTAAEWVFAHRAVLLLTDNPNHANWTPPDMSIIAGAGGLLEGGSLATVAAQIRQGRMDAVISTATLPATGATIIDLINRKLSSDLITATPTIRGLWEPNLTPTTVSLDPAPPSEPLDYYTHSGFMLQPRLADFRIEWTDMRDNTGVPDYGTRWFGLRPDWAPLPTDAAGNVDVDQIPYRAQCRHDYTTTSLPSYQDQEERTVFQNQIEWSNPADGSASTQAAYRAIWRADTWQYRPRALRFTYRIYDTQNRLKQASQIDLNEDGKADANGGTPYLVNRYGQEFSIVVNLP